jgi:hypothetical protein
VTKTPTKKTKLTPADIDQMDSNEIQAFYDELQTCTFCKKKFKSYTGRRLHEARAHGEKGPNPRKRSRKAQAAKTHAGLAKEEAPSDVTAVLDGLAKEEAPSDVTAVLDGLLQVQRGTVSLEDDTRQGYDRMRQEMTSDPKAVGGALIRQVAWFVRDCPEGRLDAIRSRLVDDLVTTGLVIDMLLKEIEGANIRVLQTKADAFDGMLTSLKRVQEAEQRYGTHKG